MFPSTEPEVWLAANPADPSNLIGSIQQDRWSDGGAQGLVAPYSRDGGRSWNEVPLPFSVCASSYYSGNVLQRSVHRAPVRPRLRSVGRRRPGRHGLRGQHLLQRERQRRLGRRGDVERRRPDVAQPAEHRRRGRERPVVPVQRQGVRHRRPGARRHRVRGLGSPPEHRVPAGRAARRRAATDERVFHRVRRRAGGRARGRARLLRRPRRCFSRTTDFGRTLVAPDRDRADPGERADDRRTRSSSTRATARSTTSTCTSTPTTRSRSRTSPRTTAAGRGGRARS